MREPMWVRSYPIQCQFHSINCLASGLDGFWEPVHVGTREGLFARSSRVAASIVKCFAHLDRELCQSISYGPATKPPTFSLLHFNLRAGYIAILSNNVGYAIKNAKLLYGGGHSFGLCV